MNHLLRNWFTPNHQPRGSLGPLTPSKSPVASALSNVIARNIMGWHVLPSDPMRHWRDLTGERVISPPMQEYSSASPKLVAAPYLPERYPDDFEWICFRPDRFDEHWQMVRARAAELEIEVKQDDSVTKVWTRHGSVELPPYYSITGFGARSNPQRIAALHALARLVADGLVDVEACGDIDRRRLEIKTQ